MTNTGFMYDAVSASADTAMDGQTRERERESSN